MLKELSNWIMLGCQEEFAIALSISRNSVAEVINVFKVIGMSWSDIEGKEENEVYQLLFPNKFHLTTEYAAIDYDHIHSELKSI